MINKKIFFISYRMKYQLSLSFKKYKSFRNIHLKFNLRKHMFFSYIIAYIHFQEDN